MSRNYTTPRKPTTPPLYRVPSRPNPHNGGKMYYLTGKVRKKFEELYPVYSNPRIMEWFGLSYHTVRHLAQRYGLEKDMTVIRRQQALDAKATCERNGYYDSIRGRRPTEACIAGTRRKWAEGFCPVTHLKQTNPRKFKEYTEKQSKIRKELFRRERQRLMYGLPTKTHINVKLTPLPHAASSQKYSMFSRNNYFYDPDHPTWICYDSQTRRSPRMEATAKKHGLRVVEGDE